MLRKPKIPFLPKYWTKVLPWALVIALAVVVYSQHQKLHTTLPAPPEDHRIDSLRNVVSQLNADLLDARHDYDSAQNNIKTSIITIREQNAKDITNISNYSTEQLDSTWSTITFP
jgi:hypothetical protein